MAPFSITRRTELDMDLATLLAPISTDDFMERIWGRKSIYIPGRAERFASFGFDFKAMRAALACNPAGVKMKAQFFDRNGWHRVMPINAGQWSSCFDAGMTVGAGPIDVLLPAVGEAVRALRRSGGFVGELPVMCYSSPPKSGFGWHFDNANVFICQILGTKRWWYGPEPIVETPLHSFVYTPEAAKAQRIELTPPRDDDAQSCVLNPGDLLYLPAGTWHRTSAEEDGSVALTMGAVDAGVSSLLRRCIAGWLGDDRRWRAALPFVQPGALRESRLPPPVARELADRLAEFQEYASRLTIHDLARVWVDDA
jgi:ribosomal protein L16 Arg81 hydroxylase